MVLLGRYALVFLCASRARKNVVGRRRLSVWCRNLMMSCCPRVREVYPLRSRTGNCHKWWGGTRRTTTLQVVVIISWLRLLDGWYVEHWYALAAVELGSLDRTLIWEHAWCRSILWAVQGIEHQLMLIFWARIALSIKECKSIAQMRFFFPVSYVKIVCTR